MRKIILWALFIALMALVLFIYEKAIISDSNWGPFSVAFISVLAVLICFCLVSLSAYKTKKREAIARIWLSFVVSATVVYLAMDLGLGFFLIRRASPPIILDEHLHHRLAPNTSSEHRTREFHYVQTVNSLGVRNPEMQLTKTGGTYRILMLGDSFTMGKGVGDDQTFSALLQESLNKHVASNNRKKFEVLNAGVDSYAPILSFLQLKQIGGLLDPDLIVLNLDMSDLIQEVAYRKLAVHGRDGQIIGVRPEELERHSFSKPLITVRNWADNNLYISRLIRFHIQTRLDQNVRNTVSFANPELLRHTLMSDDLDRSDQWRNIFSSILSIKRFCDSRGIPFLLTIYPWGHQASDGEWIPQRWDFIPHDAQVSDKSIRIVEHFTRSHSMHLLNVFSAFRGYSGERPLYYGYDMHWTPAGHELMARELDRYISREFIRAH